MSAPDTEATFLRPAEAAAIAGLSTRAIYRAIERGELRAARLCSRLRIPRTDFEDWVARSVVQASESAVVKLRPLPPTAHGSFRGLLARGDRGQP